jgi:hypothetical protein
MDGFEKIVISRFNGGYNNSVMPFLIGDDEWQSGQNVMTFGRGGVEVDVRPGSRKMNRYEMTITLAGDDNYFGE